MERDAWLEVHESYHDDNRGSEVTVHIRGARLVARGTFDDELYSELGDQLLCRCGTRVLWLRQLEEALANGTRRLFV